MMKEESIIYVTEKPSLAPKHLRICDLGNTDDTKTKNALYPKIYKNHLSSILIDHDSLQSRTAEIANTIHDTYPHDEPLVILCILKGSSPFFHGLCQQLSLLSHPYMIDFYRMKSYEGTESTGNVKVMQDLPRSIVGRHVIIVEDIVDTGNTLKALLPKITAKEPKSCEVCSMLVKRLNGSDDNDGEITKEFELNDDLLGYSIPDYFVIGYGLDFNEMYRDLRDIWVISEDGIKAEGYGL